ncbi:hypothetical protein TYRP_008526 [Tyrophagus putrescentiae]|nr:hypothetical protein TYRP_008526 [Tyrophagus putrescentiae]
MAFFAMHHPQDLRFLISIVSPDNWLNVSKVRWVPELSACYRQRHFGWPMSSHLTLAVCHCQIGGGRL